MKEILEMKEIFCDKFDKGSFRQHDIDIITGWSEESDSVLTISPSDMKEHPYGAMIRHSGDLGLLGYAAIKELTREGQVGQLGALIINPLSIGKKVATMCLEYVLEHAPAHLPEMKASFAYGNDASTPLFLKLGGVFLGEREHPAATGCNNVIDLTPAMDLPGVEEAWLTDILKINETRVG